jgi:hypothetical protein
MLFLQHFPPPNTGAGYFPPQFVSAGIFLFIIALQEIFFQNHPPPQMLNGRPLADTDIAQHTPYQGFSVTGYIRTGTGVKQTEVDCERNYRWRFKQPRDGFSYFRSGGWINIWGGAAACFGRGAVATPGKAKENV